MSSSSRAVALVQRQRRFVRRDLQRTVVQRLEKRVSSGEASLGYGVLADQSLSRETLVDYLRRVSSFWDYVAEEQLQLTDLEKEPFRADDALCCYVNALAKDGEIANEGEKLRAAVEALYPAFSNRFGHLRLPKLRRSLAGWSRLTPAQRRYFLPGIVKDALVEDLLDHNELGVALFVELAFSAYLRPSEAIRLCLCDVIDPVAGSKGLGHYTLMLAPFERGIASKTGKYDDAVALNDSRAPWLGRALAKFRDHRRLHFRAMGIPGVELKHQHLWPFSQRHALKAFRDSAQRLGVLWCCETLYVLRHGGASRDVTEGFREMTSVMRCGRWACMDSVRVYEKHARTQWVVHQAGTAVQAKGRSARPSLRGRFLSW